MKILRGAMPLFIVLIILYRMPSDNSIRLNTQRLANELPSAQPFQANLLPFSPAYRETRELSGFFIYHGKKIPISGNISQLKSFFASLKTSRQKKVRIAHWGDSIILGDVISESLREGFQKLYGGCGVGFISLNSDDFGMRTSTNIKFSDDWKESSIVKRNPENLPLGINGAVFQPSQGSWVQYDLGMMSRNLRSYTVCRLFYSNIPPGGSIQYSYNNGNIQVSKLEQGTSLKELRIPNITNAGNLKIIFNNCQKGYFYGVSFETGEGVYLDNFPIRGNSGISLTEIPESRLKEFNEMLNYKLLLINFGVNIVSPEHQNYLWYENKMEKVINYLKKVFPDAGILLVSAGDKAIKKGSKFVTDPGIPVLLKSQQSIADKNNIAFWNLFQAMGGENSMVEWVETSPALANKDYCHFKNTGGKIIADLLLDALVKEMKH